MSTNFFKGLVVVLVVAGSGRVQGANEVYPLLYDGVEYRVEHEQDGPDVPLKASIKAVDPKSGSILWRVMLYQGTSRAAWQNGVKNPRISSLITFAKGLVAKTDDGATFFIDVETRKAEVVRDMRTNEVPCKLHHLPIEEYLVPIHYGLATGRPLSKDQREKYPLATQQIEGGCCVMDEKAAIVSHYPICR